MKSQQRCEPPNDNGDTGLYGNACRIASCDIQQHYRRRPADTAAGDDRQHPQVPRQSTAHHSGEPARRDEGCQVPRSKNQKKYHNCGFKWL
ncbi:hypothetical protein OHV05_00970 [Kitasatospora sp. NBC_00070]|uniref:hypothetical protein n=1 Tax=Kitasatospora sp. NBC_00070 TaxID=2975962 RepID=UPI003252C1C6